MALVTETGVYETGPTQLDRIEAALAALAPAVATCRELHSIAEELVRFAPYADGVCLFCGGTGGSLGISMHKSECLWMRANVAVAPR